MFFREEHVCRLLIDKMKLNEYLYAYICIFRAPHAPLLIFDCEIKKCSANPRTFSPEAGHNVESGSLATLIGYVFGYCLRAQIYIL